MVSVTSSRRLRSGIKKDPYGISTVGEGSRRARVRVPNRITTKYSQCKFLIIVEDGCT